MKVWPMIFQFCKTYSAHCNTQYVFLLLDISILFNKLVIFVILFLHLCIVYDLI